MNGFVPNDIEGPFAVKISADSGALSGSAVVSVVNVASLESEKPKSRKSLWILIAAGAGAGIAGGVLAGGSKSSTGSGPPTPIPPSVTINPGPISVGGPR